MTRSEAIAIFLKTHKYAVDTEIASVFIDSFRDLGILKLDDHIDIETKVLGALLAVRTKVGAQTMLDDFQKALDHHGLKIVDK